MSANLDPVDRDTLHFDLQSDREARIAARLATLAIAGDHVGYGLAVANLILRDTLPPLPLAQRAVYPPITKR